MRTLLENITFVKGIEYLIVVAFCLGFIALWLLIHKEKSTTKKMISVLIPLSLMFGGGAIALNKYYDPDMTANTASGATFPEYYSNGTPTTITTHSPEKWLNINNSEYLAIPYGPATKFHQIMSNKVSCKTCHHNSDEIHACRDCHERPFNPENSSKPGLKAAYHQRCMFCHREVFGGPESCTFCHTQGAPIPADVSAPDIPHKLTWENCSKCHKVIPKEQEIKIVYHDSCLKCHTKDITGATKLPSDHAGRAGDTCHGCHKQNNS